MVSLALPQAGVNNDCLVGFVSIRVISWIVFEPWKTIHEITRIDTKPNTNETRTKLCSEGAYKYANIISTTPTLEDE
jgi:hypothetical protein